MATIVLSAVGAAVGSAIGGNVLGLSSVVIGRAIGATLGRWVDQQILGVGSEVVETGKMDRLRLTGASEGTPVTRVHGRARVPGQVIWATRFRETVTTRTAGGSGKGTGPRITTRDHSYSISLAVALCEGEITGVGRVWADGMEVDRGTLTMRVYRGTEDQMPDPKIEAVQGAGNAPAYRGITYVVLEDLQLEPYGNRVPQLTFEVMRPEQPGQEVPEIARGTRGVALVPGTGEYALATSVVHYDNGPGDLRPANLNSTAGVTDFVASWKALRDELPNCNAVSLVVSWFGDDLRAGQCSLRPKVEQSAADGREMPWRVSGLWRFNAGVVPHVDGAPVYGGTPADRSVVEAISHMRADGAHVTFYPFILMEQLQGNALIDPWTGKAGQPHLPWRGRITTSLAPGVPGSPDGTAAAEAEVEAFFGAASPSDFTVIGSHVAYTGPEEWSYRRFILHYAHLCAAAGGVDAFCIGSEMRALTQIRGAASSFPAVQELIRLAADVRAILGPETKIGYAADWSEYFGYHPQDGSGDVFFHLDPLWADANIDFIGIDNYMPLSDWRDGREHADAHWGSIYNLDYLRANVAGGEGYDWYYHAPEAEAIQRRTPIEDSAHGEHWVFRYKDIRGWWSNPHHERRGGVRLATPTPWVPESKPIWFTEFGCAAVDKGTNEPNRFLDPKSSESSLPKYSSGARDDYIQMQYLRAVTSYWSDPANNPVSSVYGGPMIDMERAHVWAWDTRPYPFFPGRADLWADAANYTCGHWINGRASSRSLAEVVREICGRAGVEDVDVGRLHGLVRGYWLNEVTSARADLQPLMLAHGFDAVEREGALSFVTRGGRVDHVVGRDLLAVSDELEGDLETIRLPEAETAGRVRLSFSEADADFAAAAEEAVFADEESRGVSVSEFPMVLTRAEARGIAERWLAEARIARDRVRFALPPSRARVMAGDVVSLETEAGLTEFRVDRVESAGARLVEGVRVDTSLAAGPSGEERPAQLGAGTVQAVGPVYPVFMDLPILTGQEVEHAPHVAATAVNWSGPVAVYHASQDAGYALDTVLERAAVVGITETELPAATEGLVDRGPALRVRLIRGVLSSASLEAVLNGANAAAIGDPETGVWEVIQFARAELVGERLWALSERLRGQAGTDGVMPAAWPAGSHFVLLDGAAHQVGLAPEHRGLERHYRVGPAAKAYDDPAYVHELHAFQGVGLRPYRVAHLRAARAGNGDLGVKWVRRTRIDGDSWEVYEVPLGEERELYRVQVWAGGVLLREEEVAAPTWSYPVALQTADGVTAPFEIDVAQISDRFGAGPSRRITING
jgi:hypothetical protein